MNVPEGYFRCSCGVGFFARIYDTADWETQGIVPMLAIYNHHKDHTATEVWREQRQVYGRRHVAFRS